METSPPLLLRELQESTPILCPHLTDLSVQGEQSVDNFMCFRRSNLRVLSLRDTAVRLARPALLVPSLQPFLDLPSLHRLELVDQEHNLIVTEEDVRATVAALPAGLREIELRLNSSLANCALVTLGTRLRQLEALSLHLPDEDNVLLPHNISQSAVRSLAAGCPALLSLEVTDGLIAFDVDAFEALGGFRSLRRVKMPYDDDCLEALPAVLRESQSLEEVLFYDNAADVVDDDDDNNQQVQLHPPHGAQGSAAGGGVSRWHEMSEKLARISIMFPSVHLGLRDSWFA